MGMVFYICKGSSAFLSFPFFFLRMYLRDTVSFAGQRCLRIGPASL